MSEPRPPTVVYAVSTEPYTPAIVMGRRIVNNIAEGAELPQPDQRDVLTQQANKAIAEARAAADELDALADELDRRAAELRAAAAASVVKARAAVDVATRQPVVHASVHGANSVAVVCGDMVINANAPRQ